MTAKDLLKNLSKDPEAESLGIPKGLSPLELEKWLHREIRRQFSEAFGMVNKRPARYPVFVIDKINLTDPDPETVTAKPKDSGLTLNAKEAIDFLNFCSTHENKR